MRKQNSKDLDLVFTRSFFRVTVEAQGFYDLFYERFIGSSPEVAQKFSGVALSRQKEMLRRSLGHLAHQFDPKAPDSFAEHVAQVHNRSHKDIQPHLYKLWLDILLDTVKELDPLYNTEVEQSWRTKLADGIAYMLHRYEVE